MVRRPALLVHIKRVCICTLIWIAAAASAHADMTPHQAIYKMTLSSKSPASRFNGVSGAAVSQVERTCEGWVVNEQVVMTMLTVAGGEIQREMRFTAFESLDGNTYQFESNSLTNGTPEKFSGTAKRKADGTAEAEFVTPRPFEMPLPDATQFYISMSRWLLELAESGKRAAETYAFDGTDDEGPQKVSAFVLPDTSKPVDIAGDPELLDQKAWKIRMAFFKVDTQASQPEFEMSVRLLANGIITSFELIFEDLVVDQVLQDVMSAKDERCG